MEVQLRKDCGGGILEWRINGETAPAAKKAGTYFVEGAGHVLYLERKDIFFPMLRAFMNAKSTSFEV